jgi:stress response protein YsnF
MVSAGPLTSEMSDHKSPSDGNPTVPLLEERASIEKRTVTTGKVRVVTHTEKVEELVRTVLEGEEVDVVTVELDQMVSGPAPGSARRMVSPLFRCWRKSSSWRSGSF